MVQPGVVAPFLCPKCSSTFSPIPGCGGAWKCEGCGAEFWEQEEEDKPDTPATIREVWLDEQRYKRAISKPGGGAKSSKRKRVKPGKAKRWYQRSET
jgi:ribosomal protein L37AE/L43A